MLRAQNTMRSCVQLLSRMQCTPHQAHGPLARGRLGAAPAVHGACCARVLHGAGSRVFQGSARHGTAVRVARGLIAVGLTVAAADAARTAAAVQPGPPAPPRDFIVASTTDRRGAYPEVEPYATGMLQVSAVHSLYYEESGNPAGKPVVFLHGGPGGGCDVSHRRFFDPKAYRIILFDQRGSGRSTPHACLEDNTTWHLVEDIEKLRNHLKVEQWQVFGGSWGSTLALAYAQSHPSRVTELVLRGIFMLRKREIDWYYENKGGAEFIFPDEWEKYLAPIPEAERGNMVAAYRKRLTSADKDTRMAAARAWTGWEMATSSLLRSEGSVARGEDDAFSEAFARIENHYFTNHGWFNPETQLLDNVPKIRHIPCVIVQGRYDVVCPMRSAWDLHRAWPEAKLVVVPDAGHAAKEAGVTSELIAATDAFRSR